MAESREAQRNSYPLAACNFRVTVEGETVGFTEVTGLSIEYDTITYRHGLSWREGETLVRVCYPKYTPMTLRKGVVAGKGFLYGWLASPAPSARAMLVTLCDAAGAPAITWRVAQAIPTKLQAPGFEAGSSQVSIEALDLMVRGISVEPA